MNRKYIFGLIGLFAIGLVTAGYLVSSLVLTVGVKEAFEVEYAILGNGQNDYEGQSCANADYNTAAVIEASFVDFGDEGDLILPGEKRYICARITNKAGELPYNMTAITSGPNCIAAFGGPYEDTGTALADDGSNPGITYAGFEVVIPTDAPIVNGCKATIDVTRG